MKKVGIIGLGVITKHYLRGLNESSLLKLCAVCDVSRKASSKEFFAEHPVFCDYKEMISETGLDYVIISTPPSTHFEIAQYCLENNVNVIIEKPVVLCLDELDKFCKSAEDRGLIFKTLFHWQGGIETLAFKENYNISEISEIKVCVLDPYSKDGVIINPDRRPLMGAWIDSGVNILSMIKMWLPFKSLEIIGTDTVNCPQSGLPIYANARLLIDGIKTEITVDWRKGKDQKESYITLGDRTVYINHSAQSITDGGKTVEYGRMERLAEHYYCLFKNFDQTSNADMSLLIHKFLLEVNDAL